MNLKQQDRRGLGLARISSTSRRFAREIRRKHACQQALQWLRRVSYHMQRERIVAVGLLTQRDVKLLGPTFDRLWPVEEAPPFGKLLAAIDEADEKLRRSADGRREELPELAG
jgi:hypothetical protein